MIDVQIALTDHWQKGSVCGWCVWPVCEVGLCVVCVCVYGRHLVKYSKHHILRRFRTQSWNGYPISMLHVTVFRNHDWLTPCVELCCIALRCGFYPLRARLLTHGCIGA